VENHATYTVLRLARARAAVGQPALAVGYGAGNQLPKAIGGVTQLDPVPVGLWYFGDLDEDGLAISHAAAAAAAAAGLPPLRPALPLYRALLEAPRQPAKRPVDTTVARRLCTWIADAALQAVAVDVLTTGHRIAQEAVGYEAMLGLDQFT
jgi:hypothetical protein